MNLRIATIVLCVLLVGVLAWGGFQLSAGFSALDEAIDPQETAYTGSETCIQCHDDRHDSWSDTFHRTMTQEANHVSVQGRFDGRDLDYWGMRVRPVEEDGQYYFDYIDPDSGQRLQRVRIERTVGSHRYQQYLTRLPGDGGTYVRLHYLWHNEDQRWVHMNAAFLGPDNQPFDNHVAIWNQNCIFCHNTGPVPNITNLRELEQRARAGERVDVSRQARFDSKVAELGIACETCHGPGAEHVERAGVLWGRLAMHLSNGRDTSIVNPVRLDHERGNQVCGQCHAQRTPREPAQIRELINSGPSYRPGDNLHQHVNPIWRDTQPLDGAGDDIFRMRFWNDGTPRLTAYEYQGLLLSPDHQEAELTCMDCHTMHAGDPSGQLTDRNRGNAPCLRCHQDFRSAAELESHTRHAPDSPGSVCYNCHMPHLTYGVMGIHRSHRIEIPDATADAANGRPNACLLCHLEEPSTWAAGQLAQWPSDGNGAVASRFDGLSPEHSEAAAMLAGDPVQKAILAWRAGHDDNYQKGRERAWLVPYLLEAMADIYPSSRRFAHHSLRQILQGWPDPDEVAGVSEALEAFDFMGDEPEREAARERARDAWLAIDKTSWPRPPEASGIDDNFRLPESLRSELMELGRQQDKQISIGE